MAAHPLPEDTLHPQQTPPEGLDPAAAGGRADALAESAENAIQQKSIGERIKYLRQRKGMGLVELGRHTGLSASFLSQLETGRVVPTLRNLARIALVFSRDLNFFFEPEREDLFRIIRSNERARLPQTGAAVPGYFFESLGTVPNETQVAPYIAEFLPSSDTRPQSAHQHTGAEFLYVLTGQLRVTHGDRVETFGVGDALYFHSGTTHSYQRVGDEPCRALILTMPQAGQPVTMARPATRRKTA